MQEENKALTSNCPGKILFLLNKHFVQILGVGHKIAFHDKHWKAKQKRQTEAAILLLV